MNSTELRASAERWLADDPDAATQAELKALLAQSDLGATDLADRFVGPLEFGTAGLRGVIGAGPNRMNLAVVARATWGLAQEVLASVPGAAERGVVVGGDARRMSREFSEHTAAILAAAGLRVTLFRTPVPTPLVGYAVKTLGAAAGVVVTASHNPPEYNGYKVYWENSAQIIPPIDARIAAAIARAPSAKSIVQGADFEGLRAASKVVDAPESIARGYVEAVVGLSVQPRAGDRSIRIVYTPMHGVGDILARATLAAGGFTDVTSVPEQQKPDAAFPTVAFPNPEEKGAMDLSFALAKKLHAHLIIANDPDADRLALAIPDGEGFRQLTGNQVGTLLGHYLLVNPNPKDGKRRAVLASIVSSPLLGRIAGSLGVRYEETLTGFKWIANRAIELEREGYEFVFGYEEALGYCVGSVVRDKDGISAALLASEVTAVLRAQGKTVGDELDAIARRWGVFESSQVNVTRKGAAGATEIAGMMNRLRASPPKRIADDDVVAVSDYENHVRVDTKTGASSALTLPKSNVLTFDLASGSRIIARPSGTEPKAKFYFDVREEVRGEEAVSAARERALASMKRLAEAFSSLANPTPPV